MPSAAPQGETRATVWRVFVGERFHNRPPKKLVQPLIEFRDDVCRLEGLLVGTFEAIQARNDIFETQFDKVYLIGRFAAASFFSAIFIPYSPGGSASIDLSTDAICFPSFFATLPETKIRGGRLPLASGKR